MAAGTGGRHEYDDRLGSFNVVNGGTGRDNVGFARRHETMMRGGIARSQRSWP